MSAFKRVHEHLKAEFASETGTRVILTLGPLRDHAGAPAEAYVDVQRFPGRFDGKDWDVEQAIHLKDGTVTLHEVKVSSSGDDVMTLDQAGSHSVPQAVLDAARQLAAKVDGFNLHVHMLDETAYSLLDLLREAVLAQASGDDDALEEAMARCRKEVLRHMPEVGTELAAAAPRPRL